MTKEQIEQFPANAGAYFHRQAEAGVPWKKEVCNFFDVINFYKKAAKKLQKRLDQLQGYLDHDIEYDIEQRNMELEAEMRRMKEQLREAKYRYDRAADKTPVRACGAEYRLFCDIERMLEDWEAEDD